jgi:TPR repeat protein
MSLIVKCIGEDAMKIKSYSPMGLAFTLSLVLVMCMTAVADEQEYDASTPLAELKAAASGGDAGAMLEYGTRLVQSQGIDANTAEGLDWLQKAADAGNAQAWYAIGFVYSNGVGVEMDLPGAIKYFRKGAVAGDADCQTSMGMVYQAGDKIPSGIEADPAEAAKWYRLAADQDHTEAIQHLAMMNAAGMGIEKNEEEAARLFRKGAELGNADCIWGFGRCYLKGSGVIADSVMAYALYSASLDGVEHPEQKKAMTAKRDELGKALTSEQIKRAEPIIQEWKDRFRN